MVQVFTNKVLPAPTTVPQGGKGRDIWPRTDRKKVELFWALQRSWQLPFICEQPEKPTTLLRSMRKTKSQAKLLTPPPKKLDRQLYREESPQAESTQEPEKKPVLKPAPKRTSEVWPTVAGNFWNLVPGVGLFWQTWAWGLLEECGRLRLWIRKAAEVELNGPS